jgi:hypothetical protein
MHTNQVILNKTNGSTKQICKIQTKKKKLLSLFLSL